MIEIDRYFASNPELKHYFYGGKTIIESDDRYETVRSLAEMMADLIEHAYVQRNCLPPNVWPQWLEYFTDIYNDSSMLRFHLAEAKSKSWYANEILQLIEEVNLKRKKQGANTTSDADSSSSQG